MPHSSGGGGGSFGGGGGSSFSSGSGSGGSSGHTSKNFFQGADRYVYYHNGEPHYIYSDRDPSKGASKWRFLILLFYLPFLLVLVPIFSNALHRPAKLNTDYNTGIVVEDNAGVIKDTTDLEAAMEGFFDQTGIAPALVTVNNEDWQGEEYGYLTDYAYNCYLEHFNDERHWLIVYSEPKDPSEGDIYYWEGMQGDETDEILTEDNLNIFNQVFNDQLAEGERPDVASSLVMAFSSLENRTMKSGFSISRIFPAGIMLLFIVFHATGVITSLVRSGRYKNAVRVGLSSDEEACSSCGGRYVKGTSSACPHCGAPVGTKENVNIITGDRAESVPVSGMVNSYGTELYNGKVRAEDIDDSELPLSQRIKGIFKSKDDEE